MEEIYKTIGKNNLSRAIGDKKMDGYVRFNTDYKGKVIDVWEEWYKDERTEDYIDGCGISNYLDEHSHKINSLILVTFTIDTIPSYDYWSGQYEYEDEFNIENEIVLIENYNYEDIKECEDLKEIENTLSKWNDEI